MRKNSGPARLASQSVAGGQIVLIILLIMIVGLTVGLAVIARSVTNLKISTQTEESQRAFSAAEAGVESALITAQSGTGSGTLAGAQYTVTVSELGTYSQELKKGEGGAVWLVGHDGSGNPQLGTAYYKASSIDICWGPQSPIPALEVTIIYKKDGTKYKMARAAYDPDDSGRRNTNKFADINDTGNCGLNYRYRLNFLSELGINPLSGSIILEALHLKPIYNNAQVAAQGAGGSGGNLPSQGKEIISTGTAGQTVRKIKTVRAFPSLPEIFDYVMFSGTSLTK